MKQRISLLIIVLYAMTAMGQNPKSTNLDFSNRKNGIQFIQNRLFAAKAHHFLNDKLGVSKVAFKSAGVQKMALDSIISSKEMRNVYTYDGNTNSTSFSEWDTLALAWKPSFKVESAYDENGHVTSNYYSNWDDVASQWNTSSLTETSYDSFGYPKDEVFTQLGDDGYIEQSKFENTYDKSGYPTISLKFMKSDSVNWLNNSKTEYAFDANGNKLLEAVYMRSWNTIYMNSWDSTQVWIGSYKYEYQYDSNNKMLTSTEYQWNFDSSTWLGIMKSDYSYNIDQNPIMQIDYKMINKAWVADIKTEFNYDTRVSINDLLVPQGYRELGANNMISQIMETPYNAAIGSWTTSKSILLYYSNYIDAGISTTNSLKISMYPNPTTESFRIGGLNKESNVTILDLTGKLMYTKIVSANEPIAINSLPKGVYLVKVISGNSLISQKLIKK